MSFLAPLLLFGLPLALLPLIIHLIHLLRRRQVKWAAMMFLLAAQKMNKGLSKLRQYLILAFRMLAVAALIFMVGRPLAGGLLGLTGGAPDSVIILLDRSASMEQQLLSTGTSKRSAGLKNLTTAIKDAYGTRSKLTLIDSATLQPVLLEKAEALADLPQSGPTDTPADVPSLLQSAFDYITTNQTGRTDVWLVSDLRQSDWNARGGRWTALRAGFAALPGVRFQVLAYPETQPADLGVSVAQVARRETADKAELLLDIRLQRGEPVTEPQTVPLRVVVNGVSSTLNAELKGNQVLLQAQAIPIDKSTRRGWGRVELPADTSPGDNAWHFVFDEPPPLKSVIVSDTPEVAGPLQAALSAPAEPSRKYESLTLSAARAAEIPWDDTALIVWHAPLPDKESAAAGQLEAHLRAGRSLLFLPVENPGANSFSGLRWTTWQSAPADQPALVQWWRSDAGLLAATRAGTALPVGETEAQRWCGVGGESVPLARLGDASGKAPLLVQASRDGGGSAWFLTTLPGAGSSSLARDGVVLFALLHRALNEGAGALGNAQQRFAGQGSLGETPADWKRLDVENPSSILPTDRPLRAGILQRPAPTAGKPDVLVALNRPPGEDAPQTLAKPILDELFAGLDWRLIEQTLANEKSLTSEVWRTFLWIMAAALILEALLSMPERRATVAPRTVEPMAKPA
jgi:Aerotolerance regulator N-terminal